MSGFDLEAYDWYIKQLHQIETELTDVGETPVSKEVEHTLRGVKERVRRRVGAALVDGQEEIRALCRILGKSQPTGSGS